MLRRPWRSDAQLPCSRDCFPPLVASAVLHASENCGYLASSEVEVQVLQSLEH